MVIFLIITLQLFLLLYSVGNHCGFSKLCLKIKLAQGLHTQIEADLLATNKYLWRRFQKSENSLRQYAFRGWLFSTQFKVHGSSDKMKINEHNFLSFPNPDGEIQKVKFQRVF